MILGFTILALFFLVSSSAYFSSTETAFFSLSMLKIKAYKTSQDPRKKLIAHLLLYPRDLLVTVFLLNTLVNILVQNVSSSLFVEGDWASKVFIPFVILLIFGEIIPKYLGMQLNEELAYVSAPSINFFQAILSPIRKIFVEITAPVSKIMFFFLKKEDDISKEELLHVLKKSEEIGLIPQEEGELVSGYLNLQDLTIKEVMWPREDVLYFDINDPLSKLIYLFADQQCSRLPICDGNLDNILGILSAKDFFVRQPIIATTKDLVTHVTKPYYIPENTQARTLIKKLDEIEQEIAIVVDEYGTISGLIAYEDLVEVVIGNISDLRDQKPLYTKAGPQEIIASGKLELTDFNQIFDSNLKSKNNLVTLGGWLMECLGEIPKSGAKYETENFLFHILAADPNRIRRIYIRKLAGANSNKNRQD